MKRYYKRESVGTPVWVNGHPLHDDLIATEDSMLIAELDKCVAKGIGGVVSINEADYALEDDKKKQSSLLKSPSNRPNGRQELSALHAQRVVEAVGRMNGTFAPPQRDRGVPPPSGITGRPMPDPIQIPSPNEFSGVFLKPPPTAKASDLKAASKP